MRLRLCVSGLLILLGVACSWNKKDFQNILRPVRTVSVESLRAIDKVYTGVVEADEYSDLAFKVSGPLVAMNVDAGQRIKKGTVVAAIDPLDYELQFEANKAAYVTAASQMERNKNLLSMQAISKQEYEVGEANYMKAKTIYETSRDNLGSTRLTAPFDGFVERKYVENYQKVQPGEPVIRLVNPYKLSVGFILPETSVGLIRLPVRMSVEFDTYKGMWFNARIKEVVDASPDGNGVPVKLAIDDKRFEQGKLTIYPGFSCRINMEVENSAPDNYVVPLSAVFKDLETDEMSVWLFDASTSTVKRQKVAGDQLFGRDQILIRSGLKNEDTIVVAGGDYITEGVKVKDISK